MRNCIYKLLPKDYEQEELQANMNWYLGLNHYLNQLPIRNGMTEYFYKIYSISNEIYLETNFNGSIQFPDVDAIKLESGNDLIIDLGNSFGETVLKEDYLKINGEYFRLINLYEFSKSLSPSELMDIGDFCLFFRRIDPTKAKSKIELQRKVHHSHLYSMMRNIESENSFKEAESVTEEIIHGETNLFECEGWIIIKAETESELREFTNNVLTNLKQLEFEPLIETEGLKSLFLSILYNGVPTFKRSHGPTTRYLSHLLPLKRDILHEKGIELESIRGNKIYFDLFDEESLNFNILISGQSGTGKSMMAQKILIHAIEDGSSAIVLDLGNSFKKTVKFLGGDVLSESFNPMQFKNAQFLKEIVISVIPESEINQKIEGKIFSIIEENLERMKTLKELIVLLNKDVPDIEYYFSELWPYFDDEKRELSRLTYVDTSLYPDRIKAPLIIYLIECFKSIDGRKVFAFDEVWSFLNKNAEYISECFRTFRKHGASAIAISQGIEDFIQSPLGLSIAQNSFTKFYFNQTGLRNSFLDDFDLEKIKSLKTKKGVHSSFYIKSETKRKIAIFRPDLLEYELFTSNYEDNQSFLKFQKINEQIFNFSEVMKRYVHFKYFIKENHNV